MGGSVVFAGSKRTSGIFWLRPTPGPMQKFRFRGGGLGATTRTIGGTGGGGDDGNFSPWAASRVRGGRGLPLRRMCFCERGGRAVVAPRGQNPVLDRWGLGSECPAPLPTAILKPRWGGITCGLYEP